MCPSRPCRFAVIDLGSNTARLVVIDATPGHSYRMVDQVREVVRLRQDTTEKGLTEDAMGRGFAISLRDLEKQGEAYHGAISTM